MRKNLVILLTLCLLVLAVPFAVAAAAPAAPEIQLTQWPGEGDTFRIGEYMEWRAAFAPIEGDAEKDEHWDVDNVEFRVFSNGKEINHWWWGWYFNEEDQMNYSDNCGMDVEKNGKLRVEAYVNYHHYYWVDDNDNLDEWVQSNAGVLEYDIAKGAPLGEIQFWENSEIQEGRPLDVAFAIPRTPDWEDPTFRMEDRFFAPVLQYSVVKKGTKDRVDIAARRKAKAYHETRLDQWEWWDDQLQQQVYYAGANVVITNDLDAGEYVVTAKVVDKTGNHDPSPEFTTTVKVGEPASGITITFDKDYYELGDKATITIDAVDARTFNIWIGTPDGKTDLREVVKAKNGNYSYTTKALSSSGMINVEVYSMDGLDLENIARANADVRGYVRISADKKEYDVGDTAKLTLTAYGASEFYVNTNIERADGTREFRYTETVEATDGAAVYEIDLDEAETVYIEAWTNTPTQWYEGAHYTIVVLDEEEKPISLKAPKGLTAKVSGTNIQLAWKAVENAQQYIVYRRSGDDDYEEIGQTAELKYLDNTVKAGILYSYRVSAFATNKIGDEFESNTSAEKSSIVLAQAKKLTAKSKTSKTMALSWKAVAGAGSYEVYYTTSKKAPKASTKATTSTSDLSLTVNQGLKGNKTYYVYVRAIKALDNGTTIIGPWTAAVTVKVLK